MPVITVINDNHSSGKFGSEHGLSYLIDAGEKFLFDTGPSDIILRNAEKLDINLDEIQTIILSHGHWDHGNGLLYLFREDNPRNLVYHPDAFEKKYRKADHSYIGLPFSHDIAARHFQLIETTSPLQINNQVVFLGEIPRNNDFEAKVTDFEHEDGSEDFVNDDSGLAIRTSGGLIVVTGCGHAGICNTIRYAQQITGEENILAVLGGFHLKKDDEITKKVVACFRSMKVKYAFPSHCTGFPALSRFYMHYKNPVVSSGDVFTFAD
jgi:7,8-dihydropterin-6-yl-methyl-4-(beta-D-ribofuranosyl)aminobenzene 5'-phosphate synthase